MKKTLFNLEDEIVRDSLDSLSSLECSPVVVGGLCVQLHASKFPNLLRKTSDVDVITEEEINYSSFLEGIYPIASDSLRKRGYKTQSKNGRINNSIIVLRDPNKKYEHRFLIHFTKPGEIVRGSIEDYIHHEISHSKNLEYGSKRKSVKVLSLEEALPLKIRRSIRFGSNRESMVGPIYSSLVKKAISSNWDYLAQQPIREWIRTLDNIQENYRLSRDKDLEQTYKLSKDIYDLCLSAKLILEGAVEFDKDRYNDNNSKILEGLQGEFK